jgi:site-specific DNA-methyltransferase (adenine-specific)
MPDNVLYYGDNLGVMREHIKDASVDLIYLDPPFKSNQDYNVLFAEKDGSQSSAQIQAFDDTWHWDEAAARLYNETVERGGKVAQAMIAFRTLMGDCDMLAYLTYMAPRLVELRRVMKETGSIYLHCDPTAGHYLKVLMDAIFGPLLFRNDIIWRRTGSHNKTRRFAPIHDLLLFYADPKQMTWNGPVRPFMRGHIQENFIKDDIGYRSDYYGNVLTGSGRRGGESGRVWRGFDPTAKNRHWAIPGAVLEDIGEDMSDLSQHQKLDRLFELGYITIEPGAAWPVYQRYLNTNRDGQPTPDIWAYQPYTQGTVFQTEMGIDEDVRWLSSRDKERLGYQTQKPEGLLERIIRSSSNEHDVVLDPFCGCGTAVAVAQKHKRRWIGIDITYLAINLIKKRMADTCGGLVQYEVLGEPKDLASAKELAATNPYQFQWWALGLVDARPAEQKKGADKGIDGRMFFHDETKGDTKQVLFQVKAGHTGVQDVRDLRGTIEREKAEIGVLITMQESTQPMRAEAASAGSYHTPGEVTPGAIQDFPRLQILSIEELMAGKKVARPFYNVTFKKAPKATVKGKKTELGL